ncbi:MAG: DUF2853 family protein [Sphingomonadaceae bacterium]
MDKNWAADVKKFVPDADDAVIAGIVRYCGIALQKQDSSLVSMSDPVETGRVRENFLKKKLGLTDSNETLDAIIAKVGERMKGVNFKNRVTVYYLLLEELGLLHLFRKGDAAPKAVASASLPSDPVLPAAGAALAAVGTGVAETASSTGEVATDAAAATVGSVAAVGATAAAIGGAAVTGAALAFESVKDGVSGATGSVASGVGAGVDAVRDGVGAAGAAAMGGAAALASGVQAATAAPLRAVTSGFGDDDADKKGGMAWLWWLLLGLGVLALLWWLFLRTPAPVAETATVPVEAAAPAAVEADANVAASGGATETAAPIAIPSGAGVISETRDGKPFVRVFFDTAKADVVPAFTPAAEAVKAYLDANPAAALAVSGFNDPRGDAAANALLSKQRAEAVKASLAAAGIAGAKIELIKPEATTDTAVSLEGARRVEVSIK